MHRLLVVKRRRIRGCSAGHTAGEVAAMTILEMFDALRRFVERRLREQHLAQGGAAMGDLFREIAEAAADEDYEDVLRLCRELVERKEGTVPDELAAAQRASAEHACKLLLEAALEGRFRDGLASADPGGQLGIVDFLRGRFTAQYASLLARDRHDPDR
jgi:hypothetical protein